MKPRGFALLTLLPYIIGGIAIASLAGWLWWKADHWCNSACDGATDRAVVAEGRLVEAQERATALALLWSHAIQKVEVHYVEVVREREAKFANIRERAGRINVAGGIRLSPDAVGVLADSASAANDSRPPGQGEGTAQAVPAPTGDVDTTAQAWITFSLDAAEAYRDAADKLQACVAWADAIKTSE